MLYDACIVTKSISCRTPLLCSQIMCSYFFDAIEAVGIYKPSVSNLYWSCIHSSSRSRYRGIFRWCASTKLLSWQTVSSRRTTNRVVSIQTTMSGLRSVAAMWGGSVYGDLSSKSAMMDWPAVRCSHSRFTMTRRIALCLVLYLRSWSATGQLKSTCKSIFLSPHNLHTLGWPFRTARLGLGGSVSWAAFSANFSWKGVR